MSRLHGKQLKGSSVLLDKIDPSTGQVLTLVGTTKIQQPQAPVVGDDLANKTYVDSIASGLDPKEAVNLGSVANITATYNNGTSGVGATLTGTGTLSIDGVTITLNDRILVKSQTNTFENGIYDVTTAGTSWILTRATDFDGDPGNEVNGGEFTFVMSGSTLADTGWVVSEPSGVNAVVGTTPIIWTQFSSAGVINAGAGLEQSGNTINFQTGDASLTVGATNAVVNTDGTTIQTGAGGVQVIDAGITETQLNSSVAGAGLSGGAGVALSANVINGLSIVSDFIELGGTLTKNTTVDGGFSLSLGTSVSKLTTFDLNTSDAININSNGAVGSGISLGATGVGHGIDLTFDSSVFASTITDISSSATGIVYGADYSTNYVNRSLVDKQYVDTQIATVPVGDITGVTAGAGLIGGGASGFVTLDVAGGTGIGVNANDVYVDGSALSGTGITWNAVSGQFETTSGDITGVTAGAGLSGGGANGFLQMDVELTTNGGLTFSATGDAGTLETDNVSISSALAGNGLVQNVNTIDVNTGDGLTIVSDVVKASLVTNSGLTFSVGSIDLSLGTGLAISSGNVITNTTLSLLTGDLVNTGVATGSTIQAALEAMDVTLGNVEVSENVSVDLTPAAAANFTSGINAVSATTFTLTSDGDAWVYLNGASQVVGGTTASAWFFSGDGGTTANANKDIVIGDQLIVNIDTLGYSVSGANFDGDVIEVKYDGLS